MVTARRAREKLVKAKMWAQLHSLREVEVEPFAHDLTGENSKTNYIVKYNCEKSLFEKNLDAQQFHRTGLMLFRLVNPACVQVPMSVLHRSPDPLLSCALSTPDSSCVWFRHLLTRSHMQALEELHSFVQAHLWQVLEDSILHSKENCMHPKAGNCLDEKSVTGETDCQNSTKFCMADGQGENKVNGEKDYQNSTKSCMAAGSCMNLLLDVQVEAGYCLDSFDVQDENSVNGEIDCRNSMNSCLFDVQVESNVNGEKDSPNSTNFCMVAGSCLNKLHEVHVEKICMPSKAYNIL